MPGILEAGTVMMADNGRSVGAALCPVSTGGIAAGRQIEALRIRAGQNIMHVDGVAAAADGFTLFRESRLLVDVAGI